VAVGQKKAGVKRRFGRPHEPAKPDRTCYFAGAGVAAVLAVEAFFELFLAFLLCFLVLVVVVDVLLALGAFCAAKAVPSTIAAPIINAENFFMTVFFLSLGAMIALTY
jgi:hypothetical protein